MNETDLSYAAGIIDGEGCIKICRVKADQLKRHFDRFQLQVQVDMVSEEVVEWLYKTFGGKIYDHKRKNSKWRDSKRWYIVSQQGGKFLELILPYLKIKHRNAELSIEFLKLPAKDLRKVDFYNENKQLNRRGKDISDTLIL